MTEPAAEPTEPPEVPVKADLPKPGVEPEPEPSPNSEAARYRVQLREAQAERDALTERLTGYQRRECEAAVADLLDDPADLFDIGQADLTGFYNEDGTLKDDELRAAAGALIDMRPKLGKPRGPRHQNFGQHAPPPPPSGASWTGLLQG